MARYSRWASRKTGRRANRKMAINAAMPMAISTATRVRSVDVLMARSSRGTSTIDEATDRFVSAVAELIERAVIDHGAASQHGHIVRKSERVPDFLRADERRATGA